MSAAPAKYTLYLSPDGSWIMARCEPIPADRRHNRVIRGVSAEKVVYVVCAPETPRIAIVRALRSIPEATRIVLK